FSDIDIDTNVLSGVENFLYSLDLSHLDASQLSEFSKDLSIIMQGMSQALSDGDIEKFNNYSIALENIFSRAKNYESISGSLPSLFDNITKNAERFNRQLVSADDSMSENSETTNKFALAVAE